MNKTKQLYDSTLAMGWLQLVVNSFVLFSLLHAPLLEIAKVIPGILAGAAYIILGNRIKREVDSEKSVRENTKYLLAVSGLICLYNIFWMVLVPWTFVFGIFNTLFNLLVFIYAVMVLRSPFEPVEKTDKATKERPKRAERVVKQTNLTPRKIFYRILIGLAVFYIGMLVLMLNPKNMNIFLPVMFIIMGFIFALPLFYSERVMRAIKMSIKVFIAECWQLPYDADTKMRLWERIVIGVIIVFYGLSGVLFFGIGMYTLIKQPIPAQPREFTQEDIDGFKKMIEQMEASRNSK